MNVMLLLLLGFVAVAGVDAIRDRTPRKPWSWARPELEFWAHRRTAREKSRWAIKLSSERTAQEPSTTAQPSASLPPASPSQAAVA